MTPKHSLAPLVSGIVLATVALTTRHPAPLVVLFVAVVAIAPRPRWPLLALAGIGLVMNGLLSWHGATELWRAPFSLSLLGRPRITLEALTSGLVTGMQIVITAYGMTLALSRTPPQALARLFPGRGPRLAVTLALRAVPDMVRDVRAMRHALAVRGVDTSGVRGASHLLAPIVARSLDRTVQSVELLHARGASGRARPAALLVLGSPGLLAVAVLLAWTTWVVVGHAPVAVFLPRLSFSALVDWNTWTPLFALLVLPGVRK